MGLALSTGCGIKAPPQPPVIRVADPTRDLTIFQENRRAMLSWSYPASTTSGESLYDLETIEIWRATILEVDAPPPGESLATAISTGNSCWPMANTLPCSTMKPSRPPPVVPSSSGSMTWRSGTVTTHPTSPR